MESYLARSTGFRGSPETDPLVFARSADCRCLCLPEAHPVVFARSADCRSLRLPETDASVSARPALRRLMEGESIRRSTAGIGYCSVHRATHRLDSNIRTG